MTPGDTTDDVATSATPQTLGDLDVLFNVADVDCKISIEHTEILITLTFEILERSDSPRKLDEFKLTFNSKKHRDKVPDDHEWVLKATKDDIRSLGAPPLTYGMSASHLTDAQFDTVMSIAKRVIDEENPASHFKGNLTFTVERGQHFTVQTM